MFVLFYRICQKRKLKLGTIKAMRIQTWRGTFSLRNGQLSQRKAAKFYGIPQATVSDHIRGRVSDGALPGRQPVIPRKFKSEIAQRAMQAASMGIGMSKLQLLHRVGRVTKELKTSNPIKKKCTRKRLVERFY